MSKYITVPKDVTFEEICFLQLVQQKMLQKLNDREKFLFVYIYMLGMQQRDAAFVLSVNETRVSYHLKEIREKLDEYETY